MEQNDSNQERLIHTDIRTSSAAGFVPFDNNSIRSSIPDRFEQQVRKHPDRTAIKFYRQTLTYSELNETANRIAHVILARRGAGQETIALLLSQGIMLIAAILGVLKAGKIYVPLDPIYPRARLRYMLEDSEAGWIVTDNRYLYLAEELAAGGSGILNVDRTDTSVSSNNPGLRLGPELLACIYYTSGSTGEPKGVMDSHRNVLHNIMRYTNGLYIVPEDRLSLIQSCGFSGCVSSLFSALLNGAAIFPFDLHKEGPAKLADWVLQERITIYHSVPALFREFAVCADQFPGVRLIRLEGDQASRKDLELYRKHFGPHCLLVNGLGTTETGIVRRYFFNQQMPIPDGLIPVGYAVEDMDVVVFDDEGCEVGTNQIGEIAVRSDYLAAGYWRSPELTEAAFRTAVPGGATRVYRTGDLGRMRSDGCLEYLGRKNFQAKVRGQWVEVAAVEAALLGMSAFKDVVVTTRTDQHKDPRLIAYVVSEINPPPSVSAIRLVLAQTLPDPTIPSDYVVLKAIPLSPDGKVDRAALPSPGFLRPHVDSRFVAPGTPVERIVAAVWSEFLCLERIGIHDNFLDLGGHSLMASRIIVRLRAALGAELTFQRFFEVPTVAGLSLAVMESLITQTGEREVDNLLKDIEGRS